jgi:hypothetical protein
MLSRKDDFLYFCQMMAITISFKVCKTQLRNHFVMKARPDVPLLYTVSCWGFNVSILSCRMLSDLLCMLANLEVFLQQSVSWYVVVKFSSVKKKYGISALCSFICSALTGMTSIFPYFPKCDAEVF